MSKLLDQALALYRLLEDPLVLSAIPLLSTPEHPLHLEAVALIESMADAYRTLYGLEVA